VRADLEIVGRGGAPGPSSPAAAPSPSPAQLADPGYSDWLRHNVRPHRDPGRVLVTVEVPIGDIEGTKLRRFAEIVRGLGSGTARTTVGQNLLLPEVRREDLPAVFAALRGLDLQGAGVGGARDVLSCPGAASCRLAITTSKGMARALRESLASWTDADAALEGISIRISGCPNSCGQHHVGEIGLQGAARKVNGRLVPHYLLYLGGALGAGASSLGEVAARVPARRVPEAVGGLIRAFRERRRDGETFAAWSGRLTRPEIRGLLDPMLSPESPEPSLAAFDWDGREEFSLDAIEESKAPSAGPGPEPLVPALEEMVQCGLFLQRGLPGDALAVLYRSLLTLGRGLLGVLRRTTDSDWETLSELRARVIDRGHLGDRFEEVFEEVRRLRALREPPPESVAAALSAARQVLREARDALPSLAVLAQAASNEEPPG